MDTERCLFIGGPADRTWIEVTPGVATWGVASRTIGIRLRHMVPQDDASPIMRTTYLRQVLTTPTHRWSIFLVEGMMIDEAMQRLLEVYGRGEG